MSAHGRDGGFLTEEGIDINSQWLLAADVLFCHEWIDRGCFEK
jgi:hypothetical protein